MEERLQVPSLLCPVVKATVSFAFLQLQSYFAFLHEEAGSGSSDLKHMYKKNWSFLFCFLFFSPVDQCICGQGFGGGEDENSI